MRPVVLGVDSSTQSTKVEARCVATGALLAAGRASHPATNPPRSEQHPDAWWTALTDAIGQLGAIRSDVVALAVGAQQHGLVLLDDSGAVLRPAKLWNDTTSAPEAAALVAAHGRAWWAARTGSVPVASFTVTKVAWVRDHEPQHHARIARVMLPHDYLTWRLTGEHVTDRGDASGTGWWGPQGYCTDVLDLVGLTVAMVPRVCSPFESVGVIAGPVADSLGLPHGVVVGPGTGDNMAAALGLALRPGDVAMSIGTSGTVYGVSARGTADETGAVAGFADASGRFLPLVCTLNATRVTETVARWLGVDLVTLGDLALAATGEGAILVPYLDGERTPDLPDATGVFAGLRTSTTRDDLALGAFDGVLCGLLDGRDALLAAGADISGRVHLVGGGARAAAYRQRLADLADCAVVVPEVDEVVATGSCVQAAAVLGGEDERIVADRWGLGGGHQVVPRPGVDARARRDAYAAARALVVS